jgi:Astacin (Peptidase family M12A)
MKLIFTIVISFFVQSTFAQVKSCIDVVKPVKIEKGFFGGVYDATTKWTNGTTIKVKFIGGSEFVRNKIEYYSKQWENYANINFLFVQDGSADIIISFEPGIGSFSHVGMDSRIVASQGKRSMNFGWFSDKSEEIDFKATIQHEFGHALGLLHEHENPYGNIKWNLPVIYNYYAQQGWSVEKVNQNVVHKYSVNQTNKKYDPVSIMHYPIPAAHTTDGYSVGINSELSADDIKLIGEMYPKTNNNNVTTDDRKKDDNTISCSLNNVEVMHNATENNQLGMKVLTSFDIYNAQNTNCIAAVYFYDKNGVPLKDKNNLYNTTDGDVASSTIFKPQLQGQKFDRLQLFIPYKELETVAAKQDIKFSVVIWTQNNQSLIQSGSYYFTYTSGNINCSEVVVYNSFDNENGILNIMPKFNIGNSVNQICSACVYFYYDDNTPMYGVNNQQVAFCETFTPQYDVTAYNSNLLSDLYLKVPYSAINIPAGTHKIKYFVALFNDNKQIASSGWYTTTFSR